MIISFGNKETEKLFEGKFSKRIPIDIQKRAFRKLTKIHLAQTLDELSFPPSNHLEALRNDRSGQYSIRINDQYRICFFVTEYGFELSDEDYANFKKIVNIQ